MRFHGSIGDHAIERYCREIGWFSSFIVGYFVEGRLRGAAQLALDRPWWPRLAELAITVEFPWQGRGVGTELARRSVTIARNRGATHLVLTCLAENQAMRQIAKKLGGALHFDPCTVAADVALRSPTAFTLLDEMLVDSSAAIAPMAVVLTKPPGCGPDLPQGQSQYGGEPKRSSKKATKAFTFGETTFFGG